MDILLEIGLNVESKRGVDFLYEGFLQGLSEADHKNRYTLFTYFFRDYERKLLALPGRGLPCFRFDVRRWPERLVRAMERSWGVPIIDRLVARPGRYAIYHSLTGRLPRLSRAKTVVTIFDLLYEVFHQKALDEGRAPDVFPSGATGEAARRANHVITISRSTRDDLIRFYRIDPAKITAIHCGVDHGLFHPAQDPQALAAARRRYDLAGRYWLFMGPFEPRRNAEGALRAVAELRREGLGRDCGLVFVGRPNAHLAKLKRLADELGLRADMRVLGYLPRADLPLVYEQALAFLHPEIYDGFSLPVLEAMACGAPVLTSNTSALPEIAGEAALTLAPDDLAGIARALRELLGNPGLRARLREAGLARARPFTWRRNAEETLRVYEKILGDA